MTIGGSDGGVRMEQGRRRSAEAAAARKKGRWLTVARAKPVTNHATSRDGWRQGQIPSSGTTKSSHQGARRRRWCMATATTTAMTRWLFSRIELGIQRGGDGVRQPSGDEEWWLGSEQGNCSAAAMDRPLFADRASFLEARATSVFLFTFFNLGWTKIRQLRYHNFAINHFDFIISFNLKSNISKWS